MATRDPQAQMSQIQRQIQQDWANREYIEVITCSIKKIADFLNSFGNKICFKTANMYYRPHYFVR